MNALKSFCAVLALCSLCACDNEPAAPAQPAPQRVAQQNKPAQPTAAVLALLNDDTCAARTLSDPNANHVVEMPLAVVSGMETYDLRLSPEPALPPLNAPFTLVVTITERDPGSPELVSEDVRLSVDGWMPDHLHGFVIRPSVARTGPGQYTVSNMLLHMEGKWQIFFDITRGAISERAQIDLFIR